MTDMAGEKPRISIVVEGYNESNFLGTAEDTLKGLQLQDFPLDQVEVILIGSSIQAREWNKLLPRWKSFLNVQVLGVDGAHYFHQKNKGAQVAAGDIIAFADSDVFPKPAWLSSLVAGINNGADMVVGPSLYQSKWFGPDTAFMQAAASISWGFVVGKGKSRRELAPVNCLSHNVAFRSDVFRRFQYRTDLGRTCSPTLLMAGIAEAGGQISLRADQQVVHVFFSWRWWLSRLHFRYGYEVHLLRRLDHTYPNQWITRTKVLEPLVTMAWHIMLDVPRWFRFSRVLGIGALRRWALLPIVMVMSTAARGFEMAGMYSTLLAPQVMKRWAETN